MEEKENLTFKVKRKTKKKQKKKKTFPLKIIFYSFSILFFILFISICLLHFFKVNYNKTTLIKKLKESEIILINNNQSQLEILKNKTHIFSILLPGNNCPNKKLVTLYVKRKNNNNTYKELDEKNIQISSMNYYEQSFFTEDKNSFREQKLKELGLILEESMDIRNLYLLPYTISEKLKKNLMKSIISKYQKINRFFIVMNMCLNHHYMKII